MKNCLTNSHVHTNCFLFDHRVVNKQTLYQMLYDLLGTANIAHWSRTYTVMGDVGVNLKKNKKIKVFLTMGRYWAETVKLARKNNKSATNVYAVCSENVVGLKRTANASSN